MKLTSFGANQTEIDDGDKTVFYSYSTPVAVFVPGRGAVCTTEYFSNATSRHVNQAVERWGATRVNVSPEDFAALMVNFDYWSKKL